MAAPELAASYAALILADDNIPITSDKLVTLIDAANVDVEPIWATLLAKALEGKNVSELLSNIGSGGGGAPVTGAASGGAPAASAEAPAEEKQEEKKEEKEESDEDMGFGLFD